jgi:hypothetical protein
MLKQLFAAAAVIAAAALIQPVDAAPRQQNAGGHAAARAAPRAAAPRAAPRAHFSAPRASRHFSAPRSAFRASGRAPRAAVGHQHRAASHARAAAASRHSAAASRHSAARAARQQSRKAAREARQNRRENAHAKQPTEKLTNANERRINAREKRQDRREAAKERREQRHKAAQDQREQRRDAAQNRLNAQDQKNARQQRQDARQDRRQARQERRADRRARVSAQQARQGRFAARVAQREARRNARIAYRPYRWAWRHHRWAGFVPWYGTVFWPYAYADIFGYTFWPYGYDPGYWDYAYDDFFDSVFWGYDGPPAGYASVPDEHAPRYVQARRRTDVAAARELCKQPGSGITAWPFGDIAKKVDLSGEQKQLLDDMKAAAKDAAKQFADSCPPDSNFASTPPGRLDAMTARLDATLQAIEAVRPSLERFYASLSDEQKERFNEIGPNTAKIASASKSETQGSASDQAGNNCGDPKPGLANLPIERIETAVKPDDSQEDKLKGLETATNDAVSTLQAACPDNVPMTPPGRLDAMETRLKAMVEAANTVKPALDDFYKSLNDEQKARFNKLGSEIAKNDE